MEKILIKSITSIYDQTIDDNEVKFVMDWSDDPVDINVFNKCVVFPFGPDTISYYADGSKHMGHYPGAGEIEYYTIPKYESAQHRTEIIEYTNGQTAEYHLPEEFDKILHDLQEYVDSGYTKVFLPQSDLSRAAQLLDDDMLEI